MCGATVSICLPSDLCLSHPRISLDSARDPYLLPFGRLFFQGPVTTLCGLLIVNVDPFKDLSGCSEVNALAMDKVLFIQVSKGTSLLGADYKHWDTSLRYGTLISS